MRPAGRLLPAAAAALAGAGLAALLAVGTDGCSNNNAVLGVVNPAVGSGVSLSRDVQPIFSQSCALSGCHSAPLNAPMSLDAGQSYGALVNQLSCESGTLFRVLPKSSALSYLVFKLLGTQTSTGSCQACTLPNGTTPVTNCGNQMPSPATPLSDQEIQLIRDWIDQGALDN